MSENVKITVLIPRDSYDAMVGTRDDLAGIGVEISQTAFIKRGIELACKKYRELIDANR